VLCMWRHLWSSFRNCNCCGFFQRLMHRRYMCAFKRETKKSELRTCWKKGRAIRALHTYLQPESLVTNVLFKASKSLGCHSDIIDMTRNRLILVFWGVRIFLPLQKAKSKNNVAHHKSILVWQLFINVRYIALKKSANTSQYICV